MGWTFTHKPEHMTEVKFMETYSGCLEWRIPYIESKVLDSSKTGNVLYFAVEHTFTRDVSTLSDKKTHKVGDRYVFALVFLIRKDRDSNYNFGYKDMDETMLPYYFDCPKRILDILTPTDNKYANEWRETCRRKIQRNRELRQLKDGDTIYFKEPMNFTGGWGAHSIFKVARLGKKLRFEFLDRCACRITKERLLRGGWVAFRGDDVVADFMEV